MSKKTVQRTPCTPRPELAGYKPPCDCAKKNGAYVLAQQLGLQSLQAATAQGLYYALSRAGYVWDSALGVWVSRADWN